MEVAGRGAETEPGAGMGGVNSGGRISPLHGVVSVVMNIASRRVGGGVRAVSVGMPM
jgi:hypothetical protein